MQCRGPSSAHLEGIATKKEKYNGAPPPQRDGRYSVDGEEETNVDVTLAVKQ
ncbi:MAG TPA: hypothetical protein VN902_18370 [Candidatus Acidoferrales bacterium]|jgi:hypothetical protein|nr:hypothetical protein [Candidatus Acidoferrales bacterium]